MEFNKDCKQDIRDFIIANTASFKADCIAYDCYDETDDDAIGLQLTIGTDGSGFGFQTGDNSFTGGAYGFPVWGVSWVTPDTDATELADYIVEEIKEQMAQMD